MFLDLLAQGELDKVSVDVDKSDKLIRLLDTVVIKLEGGSEEDLKALDEPVQPEVTTTNNKGTKLLNAPCNVKSEASYKTIIIIAFRLTIYWYFLNLTTCPKQRLTCSV